MRGYDSIMQLQEVLAMDLMEAKLRVDWSFKLDSDMNVDRHDELMTSDSNLSFIFSEPWQQQQQ